MPRGIKNAATTSNAVNGVEYDQPTLGFDDEDEARTVERVGRYKVLTPRQANFTAYGVVFVEGIGRTDDFKKAQLLQDEFSYRVVDTQPYTQEPEAAT